MKTFTHLNASSIEEALSLLRRYGGRASLIAGGTDVLGKMKDRILPTYPEALINIKTIPGLDGIREEEGMLKVGPLAILEDIAHNDTVKAGYAALAEAARRTASPHLREMGTLGGICVRTSGAGITGIRRTGFRVCGRVEAGAMHWPETRGIIPSSGGV
ncbi:MAG: FAD binding domain-containing protein [Deltaproteobacteria bacterium]|nr:FAD binding domain-containing protein [Deltaproteobacteria bacterium]